MPCFPSIPEELENFAVRHCIEADWQNDRDQFLWPSDSWAEDIEFQLDCLTYTLFHGQNCISCGAGLFNTETQSHGDTEQSLASVPLGLCASVLKTTRPEGRIPAFSPAAQAVFDAGRALWRYYHAQPSAVPDASLYDFP
jgi:hypothetical protein